MKTIIISGPSASGKTTIADSLMKLIGGGFKTSYKNETWLRDLVNALPDLDVLLIDEVPTELAIDSCRKMVSIYGFGNRRVVPKVLIICTQCDISPTDWPADQVDTIVRLK